MIDGQGHVSSRWPFFIPALISLRPRLIHSLEPISNGLS
jgi:hypothetical protein